MQPYRRKFRFIAAMVLAPALGTAAATATAPLSPFTAHYEVLRNGSAIGVATMKLVRGNGGVWTFTTTSKGTKGLASLLGAGTHAVSTFEWLGDLPQGISYDYSMHVAIKHEHRHVRFDWADHVIEVKDNHTYQFPTQPGAMERHTVILALAAGLKVGQSAFALPVAVKNRVQTQHYAAQSTKSVQVPAGRFAATKVIRTDGDGGNAFAAWFAPDKLPVPIQIDRHGKHDFALELKRWSEP